MKPTFRADLTCSAKSNKGRILSNRTTRSADQLPPLRIEYLIAKKLDGTRRIPEVIEVVKKEFNFDITEPDLQRFVNQLESMGFLNVNRKVRSSKPSRDRGHGETAQGEDGAAGEARSPRRGRSGGSRQ